MPRRNRREASGSAAFGGGNPKNLRGPGNGCRKRLRNGPFCCFCGVPLISAAFGGRKSRKSTGPWKWLPEKERTLGNGRFCCFCGVPLISAAFDSGNPENLRGPGNGFRKRSEHCEMDDFAAFVSSLRFGPSAAGNPENPRGPGNGFRKRSEYCEMDGFRVYPLYHSVAGARGGPACMVPVT